ncbi:MAG: hypothetical protein JXC33_03535 [Deltaproteobacteria bacterium]|nr:hypothetical protein [Deltaproteobacteria bacterium]
MSKRSAVMVFCFFLSMVLVACGGLRYAKVAPGAKEFHPTTIGILPVDVGTYGEARDVVDKIVTDILVKKGWFSNVISPEHIKNQMVSDKDLSRIVIDYLTKLAKLDFSDPDLSRTLGERYAIEAFLLVNVNFWDYTMEGKDKVAKVDFAMKLVNARSGTIMWEARHHEVRDYWLIKPDLADVAEDVANMMINNMPH